MESYLSRKLSKHKNNHIEPGAEYDILVKEFPYELVPIVHTVWKAEQRVVICKENIPVKKP